MEDGDRDNTLEEHMQIIAEETRTIINYFKQKAGEEGIFYWDMKINDEGTMNSIFWRDGRSKKDYDFFGDVVLLYCYTSLEYGNMFMFIGVNHHWENVMFGCAYLIVESEASFVWLLKTFLESMGNRPPRSIVTMYFDEELERAIEMVLPTTRHRLSLQCISERASSYFRCHNSKERLLQLFDKCLRECESEKEFEETWRKMVFEFNVENDLWLNMLYRDRKKWCSALTKDCFDGGIESSQRPESAKNVLNGTIDISTSLSEFTQEFEMLIEVWRRNEAKEDSLCWQNSPVLAIEHSAILKYASKHYTHKMYKLFEEEFIDGCRALSSKEILCGGALCRFELTMQGRESKVWVVNLDISTMELSCSCNKFNSMGMLCSHALKVLSLKNVNKIPSKYIIKRWTENAKDIYKIKEHQVLGKDFSEEDESEYSYRAISWVNKFIMRSKGNKQAQKIMWDSFKLCEKKLNFLIEMESESEPIAKRLRSS